MERKISKRLEAWLKLVTPKGSSWLKSSQLNQVQRDALIKKLIVARPDGLETVDTFEIKVEYKPSGLYINLDAGDKVEFVPSYVGSYAIRYEDVMSCIPECSSARVVSVKLPFPLKFGEVEKAWDETFQAEYETQTVDFDV
mgnify:CR=1 FL=1